MGDKGQLGHGDFNNLSAPKEVEFFKDKPVLTAATGLHHTIVLTQQNEVYTFGEVSGGKLGFSEVNIDNINKPRLLDSLGNKRVEVISCAPNHSIIYTSKDDLLNKRDIHSCSCKKCSKQAIQLWL